MAPEGLLRHSYGAAFAAPMLLSAPMMIVAVSLDGDLIFQNASSKAWFEGQYYMNRLFALHPPSIREVRAIISTSLHII